MSKEPRARLEPIPAERWSEEAKTALRTGMKDAADLFLSGKPDAPRIPNVLATLMHHPRIAGPWLAYNGVLLRGAALDPRHRELMILRVAGRARAPYEWLQHVRLAKQLGITEEEIEAVGRDPAAHAWTPLEATLLAATDQLLDRYRIDDDTWARLREHLDEKQLVEITFVVGSYACLAMVFNSLRIEPDPELEAVVPALLS